MIIVDAELEKRESNARPIRVGLIGAGYFGRGIARQLLRPALGMRLAAISNRTITKAERIIREAGLEHFLRVSSILETEAAIARGLCAVAEDPALVCTADNIDVVLDATSDIEYGARIALRAIEHGKHVVLNAAVDATIGPILKTYADRHRVVLTYTDGDEPGVAANLFRMVKGFGFRPVAAGNLKGLIDPYRTPETQRGFAERFKQSPEMVTSYADGTKLSMECTILANGTGLRVGKRGMYGPRCMHVREAARVFPEEQLLNGGLVDYLLGAEPGTGAFVVAYSEDPVDWEYMSYFKMGDGPFYVFYTPYHVTHLQVLSTVARAALFGDATIAALGRPIADALTVAKRDLKPGDVLDGLGGFDFFGQIDSAEVVNQNHLLPAGLAQGCRCKGAIKRDSPVTYENVEIPAGRLCDQLREEQNAWFFSRFSNASAA